MLTVIDQLNLGKTVDIQEVKDLTAYGREGG
jgi:hypothetical protein